MNKKLITIRILIFLALVFGVPWAAALAVSPSDLMSENPVRAMAIANLCFVGFPWLANLITRLITGEGFKNLWLWPKFRRGGRFYIGAWLLPLVAVAVGGLVFYLITPDLFDPNLGVLKSLAARSSTTASLNPWVFLLTIILSLVFISSPINMFASLGEEFGWRGYLLQKLTDLFSKPDPTVSLENLNDISASQTNGIFYTAAARKAALLTGLIHGIWHIPLILLTSKLATGSTVPTLLAYILFTCALSILLSWAALNSGSVWPAALGHGTVNSIAGLPVYFLAGSSIAWICACPTGLIGGIGFVLLAFWLIISKTPTKRSEPDGPDQVTDLEGTR